MSDKSRWRTFTLRPADLTDTGTTRNIELFTLAEGEIIEKIRIKHSEAFLGGAITNYTVSVGVPGDLTKYASAFDVFQPVLPRSQQLSHILGGLEDNLRASIRAAATSRGGNLDAATQGVVTIEIYTSRA